MWVFFFFSWLLEKNSKNNCFDCRDVPVFAFRMWAGEAKKVIAVCLVPCLLSPAVSDALLLTFFS